MRISYASAIGCVILLTALFLFVHTFDEQYQTSFLTAGRGPVFYPQIILVVILLLSCLVIVENWTQRETASSAKSVVISFTAIALTGAYIFAMPMLGFVMSTAIFTFVLPFVLGFQSWLISAAIAVVYTLSVWYIFEKLFLIILPTSPWFDLF